MNLYKNNWKRKKKLYSNGETGNSMAKINVNCYIVILIVLSVSYDFFKVKTLIIKKYWIKKFFSREDFLCLWFFEQKWLWNKNVTLSVYDWILERKMLI